ncbi:L,D-transpeptidase family protein [Erythrobacter dokdonensis]|uniref:ErfK/YbiS/YcfS/YnhG protein n=1 Tax=Erythrobacter dokdonensis DSW-74 TaxID=1300349 RepID=A0A1A7BFI8_9SPHN|nr:L,D-transpeptidase family protein [Erythrobacter dokdonensis]OBV11288.1 ErfK/YbiS/YcfS/YnhG protein [Erythrobacter dokdonensis DSW-74]
MIRSLVLPIALVTLAASCAPLLAQPSAQDAAEAAEMIAAHANTAFERIDPDKEMPPRVDPALPGAPASEEATLVYAGLPALASGDEVTFAEPAAQIEAARGPAALMISAEVVQPLPVTTPATAAASSTSNDPFVIKSILPIEGSIRYGDWFWDESAAPATGKLVITVDLEARVLSAFRDGHEIGTAVALLGTRKHPTPLGTFPILTKEKDNISEKYNNAPMPFTLRLTWDGIAIHGSPVLNGYASHGCIGVPDEFAAKLFAAARRGDKVIITRGRMVGVGDKVM